MKGPFILLCLFRTACVFCQDGDVDEETVQNLENIAEESDEALNDDELNSYAYYVRHRVNLNTADEGELKSLNVLTDLQVTNLLLYRKVLGPLIHTYELQAIPSWDIRTIKRLLPMVTIGNASGETLKQAFVEGEENILIRYGKALEPSKGLREHKYLGSGDKLSVRYRYRYKSRLSWGIRAEKDAGEPFLRYAQKAGFDFYGLHLFVRKISGIEYIALGDFTANLGQGLIHWQSLAFKKSAAVINIKRQSPVLKPYASTGEFNFLRGAGITVSRHNHSITLFLSSRKLTANLNKIPGEKGATISSFLTSGSHRTLAEMEDRRAAGQITAGTVIRYAVTRWQVSFNAIYHRFSYPLKKQEEPYNLYALKGKDFINGSIDYSFTRGNLHYFGELATNRHLAIAVIQGWMIAVHPKVDAAFLFRHMGPRYQSVAGNAFTENSLPTNESGFYAALTVRPSRALSIDCYFDLFRFPVLKYRVNAGSSGSEYLFAITFKPNKQVAFYSRFRSSAKATNDAAANMPIDPVVLTETRNFRNHLSIQLSRRVTLQNRFEVSSFSSEGSSRKEGVLLFTDFSCKPALKNWSAHMRLQHFTIDTYEARIYAYEGRMPSMFSIPLFYGNGIRYLLNINYRFSSPRRIKWKLQSSLAWMQTVYDRSGSIGSGLDAIDGKRKSEYTFQVILTKN